MELLFSPDREALLRLRARCPDEEEAREVPVEEDTYYRQPRRLTEESIEGATVGTETVRVPAGRFETDHVRYDASGSGGEQSWWVHEQVPGGVVRYAVRSERTRDERPEDAEGLRSDRYVLELVDFGTGATAELGLEP